jgi:hypothetical protein
LFRRSFEILYRVAVFWVGIIADMNSIRAGIVDSNKITMTLEPFIIMGQKKTARLLEAIGQLAELVPEWNDFEKQAALDLLEKLLVNSVKIRIPKAKLKNNADVR